MSYLTQKSCPASVQSQIIAKSLPVLTAVTASSCYWRMGATPAFKPSLGNFRGSTSCAESASQKHFGSKLTNVRFSLEMTLNFSLHWLGYSVPSTPFSAPACSWRTSCVYSRQGGSFWSELWLSDSGFPCTKCKCLSSALSIAFARCSLWRTTRPARTFLFLALGCWTRPSSRPKWTKSRYAFALGFYQFGLLLNPSLVHNLRRSQTNWGQFSESPAGF